MISVVIPTLNEARRLPALLSGLRDDPNVTEVIVVDGGSDDETLQIAKQLGAKVLTSARGRGQQLVRGAEAAVGEVLLFLHADSQLGRGALAQVLAVLQADPQILGGNFRVVFDGDSDFARWLTGFYAWFRGHGLYYGDSAIFVRRQTYKALGGIRPIALMEDFDFARRLERAGKTCCIENPPLVTSSRRFDGRHPVAIFCGWLWMHGLYALRVPPRRLADLYDSTRERTRGHPTVP